MAKTKRVLSLFVVALMTVFTVLSYVPAKAATAAPKLSVVTQPAAEYTPDQTISFTVNAHYAGKVMYRVILYNGTTKLTSNLWNTPKTGYYYTKWTPSGTMNFNIHWAAKQLQPGYYSMTVLAKKVGSKAKYDTYVDTHSFLIKNEEATISSIADITATVDEGGAYTLPATVSAKMSDDTTKDVAVVWTPATVDTTKVGDQTFTGKVEGYDKDVKLTLTVKAVPLAVTSVSAINARTLQVTFNKAINSSTIIDYNNTADTSDDNLIDNVVTITSIGSAPVVSNINAALASLSANGKVLTLTLTGADYVNGDYLVTISDDVTDTLGNAMTAYKGVVSLDDTTRPVISAPSYSTTNPNVAKFAYSEPLDGAGNGITATEIASAMYIKDSDGNAVSSTGLVTLNDDNSFNLNIGGFTTGENYTVTFAGIKDFAGNLITPNPTTYVVAKTVTDTTAPTIKSVVANSTGKMTITVSEPVLVQAGNVIGSFTVDGGTAINIVNGTNATIDSATGTIITVTDANLATGIKSVAISGIKDLSSNTLASTYTKVLSFVSDTTDPTVVSSQVKTISGVQYLLVQFSENVTPVLTDSPAITGTYVDSNSVTKTATAIPTTAASIYDPDLDGVSDTVKVSLATNVTNEEFGTFNLVIPSGIVKDATLNSNDAGRVAFTLTSTAYTTKPEIVDTDLATAGYTGIVVQGTEDTVTVQFDRDVTALTALNPLNYTVEGQAIFSNAIFSGDRQHVVLTMKANQIPVTSTYNFTIANVADDNGYVMTTVTTPVTFKENIKPVIKSAKLTAANKITVTFSEAVNNVAAGYAGNDFAVTLNGTADAITGISATDATNTTYVIALTSGITNLNDAVLLKVLSTNDIVDTTTPANSLGTTGTLTVSAQ
jgi:hypothetical protein